MRGGATSPRAWSLRTVWHPYSRAHFFTRVCRKHAGVLSGKCLHFGGPVRQTGALGAPLIVRPIAKGARVAHRRFYFCGYVDDMGFKRGEQGEKSCHKKKTAHTNKRSARGANTPPVARALFHAHHRHSKGGTLPCANEYAIAKF